jgi:hypothetical protein
MVCVCGGGGGVRVEFLAPVAGPDERGDAVSGGVHIWGGPRVEAQAVQILKIHMTSAWGSSWTHRAKNARPAELALLCMDFSGRWEWTLGTQRQAALCCRRPLLTSCYR